MKYTINVKVYSAGVLFSQTVSILNTVCFFFLSFSLSFSYWTASVDFKNSYDEWCIVIQKAQDKARCLLSEYDQKFIPLKVN